MSNPPSGPVEPGIQDLPIIVASTERQVPKEQILAANFDDRDGHELEPAPPIARLKREGAWNPHSLPAFVAESQGQGPVANGRPSSRFGLGLRGGVIQSASVGPLSPNLEIRGLWALDELTQIEAGVGFSMYFHENLFAYTDKDGTQIQMTSDYEQQYQFTLGIRRSLGDERLKGLYYGLAGGVMRLPIHRLIGDADQAQDAYDIKTGYFFLPKIGYVTRVNSPFSWDLSAGFSFSRANGVEFVQPVVSLGLNYWR